MTVSDGEKQLQRVAEDIRYRLIENNDLKAKLAASEKECERLEEHVQSADEEIASVRDTWHDWELRAYRARFERDEALRKLEQARELLRLTDADWEEEGNYPVNLRESVKSFLSQPSPAREDPTGTAATSPALG